jgi:hypothetical protein
VRPRAASATDNRLEDGASPAAAVYMGGSFGLRQLSIACRRYPARLWVGIPTVTQGSSKARLNAGESSILNQGDILHCEYLSLVLSFLGRRPTVAASAPPTWCAPWPRSERSTSSPSSTNSETPTTSRRESRRYGQTRSFGLRRGRGGALTSPGWPGASFHGSWLLAITRRLVAP